MEGHRQAQHRTVFAHGNLAAKRHDPCRGGLNDPESTVFASAELYDPASRTWTATGSLNTARFSHTATLLQNGAVLVAAGEAAGSVFASAELYDSASGTWPSTGSLHNARTFHTATVLQDGTALVAGGLAQTTTMLCPRRNWDTVTANGKAFDIPQTAELTGVKTAAKIKEDNQVELL